MADREGQQLGNYRIIGLLGRGGFADVYLGEHIYLKTPVAIKLLQTKVVNQEDLEGFLKEAQIIARLVHPHIVRVMDFGVDEDIPFLVMDYAPNGTLRQRHPRRTQLPLATIVPYVTQIAEALEHAHEEKLIHRDVKPENMLLGRRNEVLLSDFGIALIAQSARYQSTQDVVGTVAYMSPEQIQGKPRPASDQYSLGISIYEWLSGERPFHGSFTELCTQHMFATPPPLHEKVPSIPRDVEQVVMTALAKEPKQRFMSVQAFANAFEQASKASPGISLPSQLSISSEAATLAEQISLPGVQVTPPEQAVEKVAQSDQPSYSTPASLSKEQSSDQPVEKVTQSDQLSYSTSAAPSEEQPFANAVTSLETPLAYSVTERSMDAIRPRKQSIPRYMVLLSLAVLTAVIVAGGGIVWITLSHAGTRGSASISGGGSTTIEIATDLPVSGGDASIGKSTENGVRLAVDQANANHTIAGDTLVLVPKDDVGASGAHDPSVGQANVTALIGDALVAGIVGPLNSGVAEAEMPVANQAPIALISPSNTLTCLTKSDANLCAGAKNLTSILRPTGQVTYFRISTTDNSQGKVGADLLFNTLHYRKAWVIDDAETYGIDLGDAFQATWTSLGGTVLGRSSFPPHATNYTGALTAISNSHPDVIYFGGDDVTGGTPIRQQMHSIPDLANTAFAGGDGIVTGDFARFIAPLGGGQVYGTTGFVDLALSPSGQDFVTRYQATYGSAPTVYSAYAYDSANILIQAIKRGLAKGARPPQNSSDATGAKAFRQAVIDALRITDYDGSTGHHTFDANGDTTNQVVTIFLLRHLRSTCDIACWQFQKTTTATYLL